MNNIFLDRTYSSFPLSIGTGLALESLFESTFDRYDKDRVIPNKLNVNDYKIHIYSAYTLVRNIVSATNSKDRTSVLLNKSLMETIIEEINTINSLYINTKCKPVIYFPNYEKFTTNLNQGKESGSTKLYKELILIYNVLKKLPTLSTLPVITDVKIPASSNKTLITTSMAVDLLNIKNVKQLSLLESHTGKLKEPIDWNTKYHSIGSKPLELFPFMEELLYILGDNTVTRPMKLGLRLELFNTAFENNWTGKTTRDRVIFDINKSQNLKAVFSSYKKLF